MCSEICVFLPHGARIYNKLVEFIRNPYWNRVYQEVVTLNIYNMQLWETSGHAANYRENMFLLDIEKQEFALKPMNCPGHCLIFDHRVRSYGGIIVFYKEIINKVLDPAENFTNPTSFTRGEAPRSLNNRTPALHKSL